MAGYSLHIGLNRVDPNAYGGWDGALSGCVNDARSMEALARAAGFAPTVLLDAQASSQAVIGELSLLAQQAAPGDICLVTYSGHGGQVDDVNGDDADAQDETWVCYDRQVVDDELAQMWSQFQTGVRVLVLSDSCHSGTVARERVALQYRRSFVQTVCRAREARADVPAGGGYSLKRRRAAVMAGSRDAAADSGTTTATIEAPPAGDEGQAGDAATSAEVLEVADVVGDEEEIKPRNLPLDVQRADNERRRGTYQFVQALSGSRESRSTGAQVLLISGCQDNQLSFDGPVNGQFTGRLLQVWAGGSFTGDYTAFHSTIVSGMPPDQTPNLLTTGVAAEFLAQRPFTIAPPGGGGMSGGGGSSGAGRPVLRLGASGPDVVHLQQRLTAHGQPLTADGQFGPATDAAVRFFQSVRGLVADGVVGPATWGALDAAPSGGGGSVPTSPTTSRPTIRRGATGEHVTYLQQRLVALDYRTVVVDGIFGPGTEMAVRSFQRARGLTADGIVGQMTWSALG